MFPQVQTEDRQRFSIFISHASDFLTDCQPHGDGLAAFGFVSRLAERGHTLHVASPKIDVRGKLPENVKLYRIETESSLGMMKRLKYMVRARRLLDSIRQKQKIDVVHQLNPVNRGLSISLIGTGVPLVLGPIVGQWTSIPRDLETTSLRSSIIKRVKQLVLDATFYQRQQQAAALLVTTPAAIKLNEFYKPSSVAHKIHILPHGIDSKFFSPGDPDDSIKERTSSILFLATVSHHKGVFPLLDAFELVAKTLPTCRLKIAGAGPDLEAVEQRVATMACRLQIDLLGKVNREQVPSLMRGCSVYCSPSYGEPFGMSTLEAMACGRPVVATDAGGLAYLVSEHGGRKAPPGDVRALADALIEILSSPELQSSMGRYNRSVVETTYSWERVIERLETIYGMVLASDMKDHVLSAPTVRPVN